MKSASYVSVKLRELIIRERVQSGRLTSTANSTSSKTRFLGIFMRDLEGATTRDAGAVAPGGSEVIGDGFGAVGINASSGRDKRFPDGPFGVRANAAAGVNEVDDGLLYALRVGSQVFTYPTQAGVPLKYPAQGRASLNEVVNAATDNSRRKVVREAASIR